MKCPLQFTCVYSLKLLLWNFKRPWSLLDITGKPNRKQIKRNLEKCPCSSVSNLQLVWSFPKSMLETLFEEYFRNTAIFQLSKVPSWLFKVLVHTFSLLILTKILWGRFLILILLAKKLRFSVLMWLVQGHTSRKYRNQLSWRLDKSSLCCNLLWHS